MDRIAGIERSAAEEEAEREFEERVEAKRKECEERTLKNAEVCGREYFFHRTLPSHQF